MNSRVFAIFLVLFFLPMVFAQSGSIKLVTVQVDSNETVSVGNTPDMVLEVKPGSGNIFIDSLPLTKVDTQISTRFANAVACDFLQKDCSKYDFFYKIRADSNIVGGPSAGAAITVLTISVLENKPLKEDVLVTGTINAGGLIGPVGGIREKAIAAQNSNMHIFLIPKLALGANVTLTDISENLSVKVIPISTLEEALYYFTGTNYTRPIKNLTIPESYTSTMKEVSNQLCDRYDALYATLQKTKLAKNNSFILEAQDFYNRSLQANASQEYYSRASFCFSGTLRLRELSLQNTSDEKVMEGYYSLRSAVSKLDTQLDNMKLNTLSDLETYMIVKERALEAKQVLQNINTSNISKPQLAYALERYYSGIYWSDFFGIPGEQFNLENQQLKESCLKKVDEAKERIDYLTLYFPQSAESKMKDLSDAYQDIQDEHYGLCLFKASKVKADADILLTVLFIEPDQVNTLLATKMEQTKKVLALQQNKGMFPILGYSYFEYAKSLEKDDPYSSLIYLEYAIELSNLDMYFPPKKSFSLPQIDLPYIFIFIMGITLGVLGSILYQRHRKHPKSKSPSKSTRKKTQKDSKKIRNLPGKKR
jgi:uncharacterized protein